MGHLQLGQHRPAQQVLISSIHRRAPSGLAWGFWRFGAVRDDPGGRPSLGIEHHVARHWDYARDYQWRDGRGRPLLAHGGLWLVELNKFTAERIETEQQRWLTFFREGASLDAAALPNWMDTEEMKQAMNTLTRFSEKERDYHPYQAR